MTNRVDGEKREARLRTLGLTGKLPAALTQKIVDATRTHPTGERFMLADGKVPGLALAVYPDGAASYLLQARHAVTGKPIRCGLGSASTVTLEVARDEAERLRATIRAGGDPTAEKREARAEAQAAQASTVRRYLLDTYDPLVLIHKKDRKGTKERILTTWEPLLDVPLTQLTRVCIEAHISARKAETKPDGTRRLANGTLNRDWATFRAMLSDAVRREQLAAVPVAGKPEPLRGLREEPRVRWLGENDSDEPNSERERFFAALGKFESAEAAGGDFLRFVVRLALNTGMRRGELVRLSDSMLKLNEGRIDLPGSICKSGKGRPVYLNPDAIAAIRAWKIRGTRGELLPGKSKSWEERISQREFPRLCAAAGVPDFTFHCLRHTFASLLVKAGVPLIEVRDALGHASIVTTEKYYAHLAPSAVRKSVQALRVS